MNGYLDLLDQSYEVDTAVARAQTKKENRSARVTSEAFDMSDASFIKRYRLSKELTRQLIAELTPHIPAARRSDGVDVETKVLIALAFYATGSYQTIVGDCRKHCVSQPSVSKALKEVTMALNKPCIMNKYLSFPFQQHEREQVKREFYSKFKMPGLLGCIDGTHVAVVCPTTNEERYFNRKGYHSLNVMIICDANLNILCVDASYPGSTHDSVVWANHPLCAHLERLHTINGEDVYLLGDSGYPLRTIMMTPISNVESDEEAASPDNNYQEKHMTTRNVVERCIGVLKARFRCLLVDRKLHYTPQAAARIVNACCVLHNIAHRAHIPYTPLTARQAARERHLTSSAGASSARASRAGSRRAAAAVSQLELGRARRQALIQRLWADRNTLL